MERQRPVSCFIHGGARPWIPTINAESEFLKQVVVACSDSLGGLAQFKISANLMKPRTGMALHMLQRAVLFSRMQLRPIFPTGLWAPDLACQYEDREGRRFPYTSSAGKQQMSDPSGRPLYQRLRGASQIQSPLRVPGWPAVEDGRTFGLDPAVSYALAPGADPIVPIRVRMLPEGTCIRRFDADDRRTLIVIDRINPDGPRSGSVTLSSSTAFRDVTLNGVRAAIPSLEGDEAHHTQYQTDFPAAFLFVEGDTDKPEMGVEFANPGVARFVFAETGLDRGSMYQLRRTSDWTLPDEASPRRFTFVNGGDGCTLTVNYLVQVPTSNSSIEVDLRNTQTKFGDGTIARLLVNGMEVISEQMGPATDPSADATTHEEGAPPWDTTVHRWNVPVGRWAGQSIAVTLVTDPRKTSNADELWWGVPRFRFDPEQQRSSRRLGLPTGKP